MARRTAVRPALKAVSWPSPSSSIAAVSTGHRKIPCIDLLRLVVFKRVLSGLVTAAGKRAAVMLTAGAAVLLMIAGCSLVPFFAG
jgi:hypothetical protein